MKMIMNFVVMLLIVVLSGCAPVGMLSKSERYMGDEVYEISSARPDILDVIADVGKDMGMNVHGDVMMKANNMVQLISSSSAAFMLVGSMNNASIVATAKEEGKLIDIRYSTMGNFGNGGKEASEKLMAVFREKLEAKLGEKLVSKGEFNSKTFSAVVGTPAPNSKFAKLKIGMSINQVKSMIGESKDCAFNQKDVINYQISGYDCPYKGEGMLVYDWNRQALFRVVVDTAMGDYRPLQN